MIEHITQKFLDSIPLPNPAGRVLNYLLVMPRMVRQKNRTYQIPYGLCMVSAALKASGRNVFTLNLNYKENAEELLKQTILEHHIDVVAVGGLSGQYTILREVTDTAKRVSPDIITWVGGGIITAEPLVAIEALETADYGMIGEGEITINELAYALEMGEDPSLVPGVIVKGHDYSQKSWTPREEIRDLDMLPFPDYDGFEYYKLMQENMELANYIRGKTASIASGRSCPYNCTFCFHSSGKKYRRRSIENVLEELDWLLERYDIENIFFLDELFISDMDYLKRLTGELQIRKIPYFAQTRVDTITKEAMVWLKESGCYQLNFGVESADNRILKSMRKNITVEQVNRALDMALEVGLPSDANLIFGDLEETDETLHSSLTWWKNHPQYNIRLFWILTFPGSYLYRTACARGLIPDRVQYLRDNKMQINLTQMSDEHYWELVKKVELYQILVCDGIDLDFYDVDLAARQIRNKLDTVLKGRVVACWPATLDNISMLEYVLPGFSQRENVYFVNANPLASFVIGTEQYGKKVYTPEEAFHMFPIDTVLYAFGNRTSDVIYDQIAGAVLRSYTQVECIVKLSDLLDRSSFALSGEG